jgi:vacuolar protein sorting-associated protein IST1
VRPSIPRAGLLGNARSNVWFISERINMFSMFSSGPQYQKLSTNLRLAINRLKLLEKKKTEMAVKARKEIADYLQSGKEDRARIRVEHIVREDYMVEAMELIEMYCDLLLARMGLIQSTKEMDDGLEEPIASIIWATPRLQSEVQELAKISEQLTVKYGKEYTQSCRANTTNIVNEKLIHKLSVQAPPRALVEKYLEEIARSYNISYISDPSAVDSTQSNLLFDDLSSSQSNNRGGDGGGGGGGSRMHQSMPQAPFMYPSQAGNAPPAGFISPGGQGPRQTKSDGARAGLGGPSEYETLPEFPNVPATMRGGPPDEDDSNFDDLTKRFQELKKRK